MNNSADRQFVVFTVGEDQFAVDILDIREIARFQPLRRIPRAPDFLAGVIDLRGDEIIPVIDMHDRLDLRASVETSKSRIIVAPIDGHPVGFLVDVVRDVITVPAKEVEAPPAVRSAPGFLEGIIRIPKDKEAKGTTPTLRNAEILLLVNIGRILTSDEKLHMEELRQSLMHDTNTPSKEPRPAKAGMAGTPPARSKATNVKPTGTGKPGIAQNKDHRKS